MTPPGGGAEPWGAPAFMDLEEETIPQKGAREREAMEEGGKPREGGVLEARA